MITIKTLLIILWVMAPARDYVLELLIKKYHENKAFKQRILDDNVELARMIQKNVN